MRVHKSLRSSVLLSMHLPNLTSSFGKLALSRYLHRDVSELYMLPGVLGPRGEARAMGET